ncbi:Xenotropic and polytropic retrovirus receptor 1 [Binucleata daphniae]
MKFHKTLEKGQINAFKDFYIPYNELKSYIKTDKAKFYRRLSESLGKLNGFFIELENEMMISKKEVLKDDKKRMISDAANDESIAHVSLDENIKIIDNKEQKIDSVTKKVKKEDALDDTVDTKKTVQINKQSSVDGCKSLDDSDLGNAKILQNFLNRNAKKFISYMNLKKMYNTRKKERRVAGFILNCEKLKDFASINYTGYKKILKKYDKNHNENFTGDFLPLVENSYFYKSKRIEKMLNEAKSYYKKNFAQNNKQKAKNVFKNILQKEKSSAFASFFAGGFTFLSFFLLCYLNKHNLVDKNFLFCTNLFFYGAFLFGICMILFDKVYINYAFIFQFDVTSKGNIGEYFMLVSFFSIVFNFGIYMTCNIESVKPVVFLIIDFCILIFPFDVFARSARLFFVYAVLKIITTPKFHVQFRHFYIADCLQSFTFCYKSLLQYFFEDINPLFLCASVVLPSYFRIMQCLRRCNDSKKKKIHLYNALKYFVGVIAIVCNFYMSNNNLYYIFIKFVVTFAATTFSLFWDFYMDWGVFGKRRMYNQAVYIFISVYNVFSRFAWILTFFFNNLDLYICFCEITRRFLWTLLRVEHEHINNCDRLKALSLIELTYSDLFYRSDKEQKSESNESEEGNSEIASNIYKEQSVIKEDI